MKNNDSDGNGKMDDEEDPNLADDSKSGSGSARSLKNSVYKQHSLRLFSSIHSVGDESDSDKDNDNTSSLPDTIDEGSSASSTSTGRRSLGGRLDKHRSLRLYQSSIQSINEDEEEDRESENENEQNDSSMPPRNIVERPSLSPRVRFQNTVGDVMSRRAKLQSRPSMLAQKSRLFDSNDVMHLMGFDDE